MVPRIAKRGHSFKGAGLYYLHDKDALTTMRIGWTLSANLSVNDPQSALKMMAWTDKHRDELRAAKGGSKAGRKASTGNVYAYSLAWAIGENPSKAKQQECALETLKALGLKDHQALIIAHDDTDHKHIHVLANLVHPEKGTIASVHNDALTLSEWAEDYEIKSGVIHCPERIKNNDEREQGAYVKHRPDKAHVSDSVQALYAASENGIQFREALEGMGYLLGRGDRRGFIIMDDAGSVHSLSRQLKGQRAKDIKAFMSDVDLSALPNAKELEEGLIEPQDDEEVCIDEEAIEGLFIERSQDKREELLEKLDHRFSQREDIIREELAMQNAVAHSGGLVGIWNAVTGRSKYARSCMSSLRAQRRRIMNTRFFAVKTFEKDEYYRHKTLKAALKQKAHYVGWCQKNVKASREAFLQSVEEQKLVHE